MTSFRIETLDFSPKELKAWARRDVRHSNWPVVYALDGQKSIYVGETLNAAARIRQHLTDPAKCDLDEVRVVVDGKFNKSAALDLESFLIRLFAGDGRRVVLNRNDGITEAEYFDRATYQRTFQKIFDELFSDGLFTRTIPEIVNSDLFKFSPFKALSADQAIAAEDILEGFFADLESGERSSIVIQGMPGTGKTIIAIYLMKLIRDIATKAPGEDVNGDSVFSDFFVEEYRELLKDVKIGFVVPQQSLRESIKKVFAKTPGLTKGMVVTPFEVGESEEEFDLLIVDETHRLNRRANQASASQNKRFRTINERLFGADDHTRTQLDWIRARSRHQIFLLDGAQSVRPADLDQAMLQGLVTDATRNRRCYPLVSQMRVKAGADYVDYVRRVLSLDPPSSKSFDGYDFKLMDDLEGMRDLIRQKNDEDGLSRLVAGYAWPWKSKKDGSEFDIEIDGLHLRWNGKLVDWINSAGSVDEVGSIHTVQGYDLNYAGVIIGPDLRYDPQLCRLVVDRANYFDSKGKENLPRIGVVTGDEDLLTYVLNIYGVLLTRGIKGTYVYVCDPELRRYLEKFIRT